jgi:hypothetical protein
MIPLVSSPVACRCLLAIGLGFLNLRELTHSREEEA